jgi:ribosomal protein S18 acetylase RimI-like enzyme
MSSSTAPNPSRKADIHLRWARRADIPAIAKILSDNMLNFELHDHFVPERKKYPEEYYQLLLQPIRSLFADPRARHMVAEVSTPDPDGVQRSVIVGFATWEAIGDAAANPIAREWKRHPDTWCTALETTLLGVELAYHRYAISRITDWNALGEVLARLRPEEEIEALRESLHLMYLMVDPAWQRGSGVGRKLLQWGLDVADAHGLPIVIESSLLAWEFYLKYGFELLRMVHIDMVPEKAYDMPVVVYWPKKTEGA